MDDCYLATIAASTLTATTNTTGYDKAYAIAQATIFLSVYKQSEINKLHKLHWWYVELGDNELKRAQNWYHFRFANTVKIIEDFRQEFGLTKIEAAEIRTKSLELAKLFSLLRNTYAVDLISHSKTTAEKLKVIAKTKGVKKLYGTATNRLSKEAKKLWEAYAAAEFAANDFFEVCLMHNVIIPLEPLITRCFEILYEQNNISDAEKVIEGRRIYENIRNVLRGDRVLSNFYEAKFKRK